MGHSIPWDVLGKISFRSLVSSQGVHDKVKGLLARVLDKGIRDVERGGEGTADCLADQLSKSCFLVRIVVILSSINLYLSSLLNFIVIPVLHLPILYPLHHPSHSSVLPTFLNRPYVLHITLNEQYFSTGDRCMYEAGRTLEVIRASQLAHAPSHSIKQQISVLVDHLCQARFRPSVRLYVCIYIFVLQIYSTITWDYSGMRLVTK